MSGHDKTGRPDGSAWEIDRIVPGSKGGGYEAHNVTLSCKPCNRVKGAKLAPQDGGGDGANPKSLGAILDAQGCQNKQTVVPTVAHKPLVEPSEDTSTDPLRAPRDNDIKKWIPYLVEKKKRGQDVLLEIESVDDKALRRTLLEWAA